MPISFTILLSIVLVTAAVSDARTGKIPNVLNGLALMSGLILWSFHEGWPGLFFSLKGMGIGFALLLFPYALGLIGAGDVKLMSAIGSFLGSQGIINAFLFSSICGGAYAVGLIAWRPRDFYRLLCQHILTFRLRLATGRWIPDGPDAVRIHLYYGIPIAVGTLILLLMELLRKGSAIGFLF